MVESATHCSEEKKAKAGLGDPPFSREDDLRVFPRGGRTQVDGWYYYGGMDGARRSVRGTSLCISLSLSREVVNTLALTLID